MAQALRIHPQGFLYGSLAADFFVGKGVRTTPLHSHNWSTGLRLLESGGNDIHMLSHALGYLAHLAADVVAHNYYVPNMLCLNHAHSTFAHVLVEVKADLRMETRSEETRELFALPHPKADKLLRLATEHSPLGFQLKKRLYSQSVKLGANEFLADNAAIVDKVLPQRVDEDYLLEMVQLSLAVVTDMLHDPFSSIAGELDPIGEKNLERARRGWGPKSRPGGRGALAWPFPVDRRLEALPPAFSDETPRHPCILK